MPIHPVSTSTTRIVGSPGCQSATPTSSSTRRGSASSMSAADGDRAIDHAAAPSGERAEQRAERRPTAREPTTPTSSESRPASIMRTNRSRPNRSVPSRCQSPVRVAAERRHEPAREHVVDSQRIARREQRHDDDRDGDRQRAPSSELARRASGTRARAHRVDPRIGPRQQRLGDEVRDDHHGGERRGAAHHHGIVARDDRRHHQSSHSRPRRRSSRRTPSPPPCRAARARTA